MFETICIYVLGNLPVLHGPGNIQFSSGPSLNLCVCLKCDEKSNNLLLHLLIGWDSMDMLKP